MYQTEFYTYTYFHVLKSTSVLHFLFLKENKTFLVIIHLIVLRARDISKTLRRMEMIVDTSVGPAIFIVVGFVLKYI